MNHDIVKYNNNLIDEHKEIGSFLSKIIDEEITISNSKIWHSHPVWFINDNPIVGYSLQKKGIRLMFWSGADFNEAKLNILGNKFKDASIFYNNLNEINIEFIKKCLKKSIEIQWDYKNIVKRKGLLIKL